MLEIKLPREINKSPLATETALASLLQSGGLSSVYAKNYKGNLPAYSSLEIASIEGIIHFYIRIQKKFRPIVESNFYAQYPGIEIIEADDYTKMIRYHHLSKDTEMWGVTYRTGGSWIPTDDTTGKPYGTKDEPYKMPADFLPIKTYVDYGLDKDPKEEFKIDPITPLLELMGSIGKGEHFWYQVLVQDESVYKEKMPKFYVNKKTHTHLSLKDLADARKKQIRTASWKVKDAVDVSDFGVPTEIDSYKVINGEYVRQYKKSVDKDGKVTETPIKVLAKHLETKAVAKKEMELTPEEKDEIEMINKKVSKPLALVVLRLVYVTKKENFKGSHVASIITFPKPYSGLNKIVPSKLADPYDFPWENIGNKRVPWRKEEIFEEYVEREGFFPHICERETLDKWEDTFFWASSMKQRKLFRMIYEAVFFPFDHPQADSAFTLNLEELATLWHLPGAVAGTPTLPRIDSTKGIAPVNLPL